ncbi:hypothetical protein RQP46_003681 [Phenoliferia psychrophenolica]
MSLVSYIFVMFTALVTCAAISSMVARDTTSPALVAAAFFVFFVFLVSIMHVIQHSMLLTPCYPVISSPSPLRLTTATAGCSISTSFAARAESATHDAVLADGPHGAAPSPFSDGDSRGAVDVEGGRAGAVHVIDVIDGSRRIASNISETVLSLASASPLVKGLPKLASSLGRLFGPGSRENDLVVCNFRLDRLLNPLPLPAARDEPPSSSPLTPIFSSPSPPHPDFNPREPSREPAMRKRRFDLDDERDVEPIEELSRLAKKLRNTAIEPTSQSPVMAYSNRKPSTQDRALVTLETLPVVQDAPHGQAPKSVMQDPYSGAKELRRARDKRVSKDKKTAKPVPTLEKHLSDVKRSSVRHMKHHAAAQESLCDDQMEVDPSVDYYKINLEYSRQLQDDIGPRSDEVVNFDCINHPHVNSLGLVFLDDMSEAIDSIEYNNALVCELGVRTDEDLVI